MKNNYLRMPCKSGFLVIIFKVFYYLWCFLFMRYLQMRMIFAMPFKLHISAVVRFWSVLYILVLKTGARGLVGDFALTFKMSAVGRFCNILGIYVENCLKSFVGRCSGILRHCAIFALKGVLLCKKAIFGDFFMIFAQKG